MLNAFQNRAVDVAKADRRVRAILTAGSVATGQADRFSDLDLIVVVEDEAHGSVMAAREAFAAGLGELIAAFSGEHVGEPRLLICLYAVPEGDGVLHVDLKFLRADDLEVRVDDPVVLWDRDGRCQTVLDSRPAEWPERPAQWFEDRVWIWLHYGAARLARGERYEALNTLNWLRDQVLGPLTARQARSPQRGLRHIETIEGADLFLSSSVTTTEPAALWAGLQGVREAYLHLRASDPPEIERTEAGRRVSDYIDRLSRAGGAE